MKLTEEFNPTDIVVGSDGVDFYSLSKYLKDPARMKGFNLQDDINSWRKTQKEWIDAAPNAKRHYVPGNHELRLEKYISMHPELHGLRVMTLPGLLGFEDLQLVGVDEEVVFDDVLLVKHGDIVRKYSGYTAKGELEKENHSINIMTGHTHRGGQVYSTNRRGVVQAIECFCLCDLKPDYVKNPNWQHGTVFATVEKGMVTFEPIPFQRRNGELVAFWRGKEFSAKNVRYRTSRRK